MSHEPRKTFKHDDGKHGSPHARSSRCVCIDFVAEVTCELIPKPRDPAGSWHHVRWEDLSWELENAKECHNKYWAKRFAFERAGWPHALDKNILRAHVSELEQGERDADDEFWTEVRKVDSDWRANSQAHNAKWREIEKEYWRKAAGTRGM